MQYPPTHLVVMGVAGSGKSTLAAALSKQLGWTCAEADEFHPDTNIAKMSRGIPLQDEDRWPWLREIRDWMTAQAQAGCSTVLTCSALKKSYRQLLSEAEGRVLFLHLDGGADLISQRMQGREGHFMPPTLLPSQLATLEALSQEELDAGSLRLDISRSPEELVAAVVEALKLPTGQAPCTP
ncbi:MULTISPECIES: gluconokinase [unclassified Arthrobacter]|uniref:gluconokinase n=1 Tax=unclassified Arthrobacter TaxID=235627 RepID=UPI000E1FAB6B|nr:MULTISPECIES: gluconokinase [unclassified Arthrobacter]MDF2051600.1 gluconokinase [Arthrobacter sp. Cr_A7]RDV11027.1 gluconokinase [Arthrobacter sp. RT-1]